MTDTNPTPTPADVPQRDPRAVTREYEARLNALTLAERALAANRSGADTDSSDVLPLARQFLAFLEGTETTPEQDVTHPAARPSPGLSGGVLLPTHPPRRPVVDLV